MGVEKLFLSFDFCDVGIHRDPASLTERVSFNRYGCVVGAGSFKVVRFKSPGQFDFLCHKGIDILDRPVFALNGQMSQGFAEISPRSREFDGQIEQGPESPVGQHELQILVVDRNSLGDQVQT